MDIIWMIWDVFLVEAKKRSSLIQKIVYSTLKLFTLLMIAALNIRGTTLKKFAPMHAFAFFTTK